jgi:hypothetical protein
MLPQIPFSREIELNRIVPLSEAARLRGVSVDTIKRTPRLARKIIQVSQRRKGMRVRDAIDADPA